MQISAAQSALGHGVAVASAPAKPDCCQFFVSEFSCTRSIHLPHCILRLRQTLIRRLAKQRCGLFFIFGHTLPQGMHQGEIVLCRGVIVRSDRLAIPFDSLLLVFGYATSPGVQGAQLGLCRDAACLGCLADPRQPLFFTFGQTQAHEIHIAHSELGCRMPGLRHPGQPQIGLAVPFCGQRASRPTPRPSS